MPQLQDAIRRDVVLDGDRDRDPVPTFVFRNLTTAEWMKAAAVQDKIDAGGFSAVEQLTTLVEIVQLGLVDWRNMPAPYEAYDPDTLVELLQPFELMELVEKMLMAMAVSPDEKKSSESQPASERV